MEFLCWIHLYYKRRWWASNSNVQGTSPSHFQYFNPCGFPSVLQLMGASLSRVFHVCLNLFCRNWSRLCHLGRLSFCPCCFSSTPPLLSLPGPCYHYPSMIIFFPFLSRTEAYTLCFPFILSCIWSVAILSFGANIHLSVGVYHVCSFVIGLPHSGWYFLVPFICLQNSWCLCF